MASKTEYPVIRIAGDTGLIVEFGRDIDPDTNARVRTLARAVNRQKPEGIVEIIPTYRSLLVIYDPAYTRPDALIPFLRRMESDAGAGKSSSRKVVDIPVCYGGEYGPDMETVKAASGLSTDEVIRCHSRPEYLIYMVGFTPGFPFLGGLDEKLFTPRLKTPRTLVPEGSVGIANNQTGIYPVASPGGWQIIGKTPLKLFSPDRENPFLYRAGDKIKFIPISNDEFETLKQKETE